MLNALIPGTQIPVHKHQDTSETLVVLRGRIKEVFYNNEGKITDEFVLNSNCIGLNIPKNQWHTIDVLEPSVILEMKDGQYKPLEQDDILTL
jgi:cupin fold WbuC family metalloprotein